MHIFSEFAEEIMHMGNADAWKLYAEVSVVFCCNLHIYIAAIAQLGERQTEDLKVPGSIPGLGKSNTSSARR